MNAVNIAFSNGTVTVIGDLDSLTAIGTNDTIAVNEIGNSVAASNDTIVIVGPGDTLTEPALGTFRRALRVL